jgi:hypothetical protein
VRTKPTLGIAAALVAVLGGAATAYALHARDRHAHAAHAADPANLANPADLTDLADLADRAAARSATLERLHHELEARDRAVTTATAEAAAATDEGSRKAARIKLADAQAARRKAAADLDAALGIPPPPIVRPLVRPPCTCDAGDPDCSML